MAETVAARAHKRTAWLRAWGAARVRGLARVLAGEDLQAELAARERADLQAAAFLALATRLSAVATVAAVAEVALDVLDGLLEPARADVTVVGNGMATRLAARRSAPAGPVDLGSSAWARAVLDGDAVYVEDRAAFAEAYPTALVLAAVDSGAWVLLPLRADERTVGVLSLHWATPHRFPDDERLLLEAVAGVVATGLRRAQLFERSIREGAELAEAFAERDRIARTLQTMLLPAALPEIPGFDVAARLVPGTGDEVGGDVYDLFAVADESWVALVCDVCGKGVEAAAVAALARHAARTAAIDDAEPEHLSTVVNEALLRDPSSQFCTMALARVDLAGHVRLVLAGHHQARVLRADGRVERAGNAGRLLGVYPVATVTPALVALGPGDALVLHTDGVTERDPSFGDDELDDLLRTGGGRTAGWLVDRVVSHVDALPATHVDDVAVLVLRRASG